MREQAPSYYLTDEAAELRISKLIDRLAKEGARPGESFPASILVAADFRRGELRVAA